MTKALAVISAVLLGLSLWLCYLLLLAESDAAYWRSRVKPVEDDNALYLATTHIQSIAIQNFCKPYDVKKFKLVSPVIRG